MVQEVPRTKKKYWDPLDLRTSQNIDYPLVSVIILTYNGKRFLERNLPSILETEYPNFEVLLVDNGSTDGSAESAYSNMKTYFEKKCIPFKLVTIVANVGILEGRNAGIRNAKGNYIAFLDNDARGEKTWLKKAIAVMKKDVSVGIVQCKTLFMDGKRIDTVGTDQYWTGLAIRKGYGEIDRQQYDYPKNPIFADGPALVFRKEIFKEIGLFDPKLFIADYGDFSWRTWMMGRWRIVFVPESVVYHEGGGTLKRSALYKNPYFNRRDKIYFMLKNYDSVGLLIYFPTSLLFLLAVALASRRRRESLFAYLKVLLSVIKNLREILEKRKRVQRLRRVSTRQLIKEGIIKNPDLMMFKKGG